MLIRTQKAPILAHFHAIDRMMGEPFAALVTHAITLYNTVGSKIDRLSFPPQLALVERRRLVG